MTGHDDTTAWQIGEFAIHWFTDNDCANIDGKAVNDCAVRLRQALEAAFPNATKAEHKAGFRIIATILRTDPVLH